MAATKDRPTVIETRTFEAHETDAISTWIELHHAAEAIVVLPASSVICRTCSLPDADDAQLEQALGLQAEAHLLGAAPPHRMGRAVLPPMPGDGPRTGLVLAWPEAAAVEAPTVIPPMSYVPDVAALAALAGHNPGDEPMLWADRASGSVAVMLPHEQSVIFRATHEEVDDPTQWRPRIRRVLAETALNAGATPESTKAMTGAVESRLAAIEHGDETDLLVGDSSRRIAADHLHGVRDDPQWWARYGIAVGVILARLGPLAPLTVLQSDLPEERPTIGRLVTDTLSKPRTAVWAAVAALLLVAFGPMVFNFLRFKAMEMRHDNLQVKIREVKHTEKLIELYEHLEGESWTMSKLLADLACNTPQGVDIDLIRITQGDSISASGVVHPDEDTGMSAPEVASLMQQQLQNSRMFGDISLDWGDPDNFGNYQFTLNAKVTRPHEKVEYDYELDYHKWTLGQRLYDLDPTVPREADVVQVDDETDIDEPVGDTPGDGGDVIELLASEDTGTRDPLPSRGGDTPTTRDSGTGTLARSTGAADDVPASAGGADESASGARSTRRPDRAASARPTRDRPDSGRASRRGGSSMSEDVRSVLQEIPEALTQQQVDALSKSEAQEMLRKIAQARTYAKSSGDDELAERLRGDWRLLLDRIKKP